MQCMVLGFFFRANGTTYQSIPLFAGIRLSRSELSRPLLLSGDEEDRLNRTSGNSVTRRRRYSYKKSFIEDVPQAMFRSKDLTRAPTYKSVAINGVPLSTSIDSLFDLEDHDESRLGRFRALIRFFFPRSSASASSPNALKEDSGRESISTQGAPPVEVQAEEVDETVELTSGYERLIGVGCALLAGMKCTHLSISFGIV